MFKTFCLYPLYLKNSLAVYKIFSSHFFPWGYYRFYFNNFGIGWRYGEVWGTPKQFFLLLFIWLFCLQFFLYLYVQYIYWTCLGVNCSGLLFLDTECTLSVCDCRSSFTLGKFSSVIPLAICSVLLGYFPPWELQRLCWIFFTCFYATSFPSSFLITIL